ncbi:MAG: CotH kinase family protein [Bacteroidales bacterium]|nr:CotH kinase family protein [Candidatus Physcousia equi]
MLLTLPISAQLTLNHTKVVMQVGETVQLIATTSAGEPATNFVWGSYEDEIATISNTGLVTARKEGETIVYAMVNDGSYLSSECLVQVVKAGIVNPEGEVLVSKISFPGMPQQLSAGHSLRLQAAVEPENATDKSLRWSLDGTGAYITGDLLFTTAEGEVTVTAEALDGSRVKASFKLKINKDEVGEQSGNLLHGTYVSTTNPRCITYDLGLAHVVQKVEYRKNTAGGKMVLGVFEGANLPDFTDALPLHIIRTEPSSNATERATVSTTRGFRYVRFKAPEGGHPAPADVAFYGTPGEGDDSHIAQLTNLPTIVINTLGEAEPVDNVVNVKSYISLISKDGSKVLTDTASIRLRGNSSKEFPKKPYRIKWDEKHHVLGSPAKDKKWVLINNYSDKSLIRNMVGFEVSRCMGMDYTPFCTMADVVVNGDYRGTYQLADKIELGKNRLDIPKFGKTENLAEQTGSEGVDEGSYMVEADMCGNLEPSAFSTQYIQSDGYLQDIPFTVQYPDDDERTPEQYEYVKKQVEAMTQAGFAAPYTNNPSDPIAGLATYFDLPSFMRYFLIEEFAGNRDAYWSTLMYKLPGDSRWYYGPVWDFDIAFENDLMSYPICDKQHFIYLKYGSSSGMKYMVDAVMKALEPQYRTGGLKGTPVPQMLTDIWAQARSEGGLTEEHLLSYVDSLAEEITLSQDLNFKRWPILDKQVQLEPWATLYPTFYEHIDHLKRYLSARLKWMDEALGYEERVVPTSLILMPIGDDTNEAPYKFQGFYDLQGRKFRQSPAKGIYIRDGKKVVK